MWTDEHKMPFGKYIGQKLIDIPDSYLLWLYENGKNLPTGLRLYLEDNIEAIKKNSK